MDPGADAPETCGRDGVSIARRGYEAIDVVASGAGIRRLGMSRAVLLDGTLMFETISELDHDHIHALVLRAQQARSPQERDRLEGEVILRCRPLTWGLARRYMDRGAELDDLRAVADAAVLGAMRRFDVDRGAFIGYASVTVLGEIRKYFRDACWTIRPARSVQDLQSRVAAATDELQRQGRQVTVVDLASHLGVAEAEVHEALAARSCFSPASLDTWPAGAARPTGLDVAVEEGGYALSEDLATVAGACAALTDDERELLRLRFFEDLSQREIAEAQDRTQMQVSRELRRLLARLRATAEGDTSGSAKQSDRGSASRRTG
jgi:RNA polymerase sigma-B factor